MTPKQALEQAVEKAGGQNALAREVGCSQPTIFRMLKSGRVSPRYVLDIERATGVSRHVLAPEIYPAEQAA